MSLVDPDRMVVETSLVSFLWPLVYSFPCDRGRHKNRERAKEDLRLPELRTQLETLRKHERRKTMCEYAGICIYEGCDECDKEHPERCLIYLELTDS